MHPREGGSEALGSAGRPWQGAGSESDKRKRQARRLKTFFDGRCRSEQADTEKQSMNRRILTAVALACMCSVAVSAAYAGEGCCSKGGKTAKVAAGESGGCPMSAKKTCGGVKEEFPTMSMMVGETKYDCPDSAMAAAKKANGSVRYIVAGEEFDDAETAYKAYACAAECYAKSFTSIACEKDGKWIVCSPSGCGSEAKTASSCMKDQDTTISADALKKCSKFRVAGHTYENWEAAKKAHERAVAATKDMKMVAMVDGKKVESCENICSTMKKTGKVEYMVGTQKTHCEYNARAMMAKARVEAAKKAVDAMAKA